MNKKIKSLIGLLVVIALLGYFAYTLLNQQMLLYSENNTMNDIQTKIGEEQKANEDLKKQKEAIKSDEFIEKVAREKLGMVKPGEKVFVDINK